MKKQLLSLRVNGRDHEIAAEPNKLLLDPYAKAVAGRVDWQAPVFGYNPGSPGEDLEMNDEDDAWGVPKGVVIDEAFDWGGDRTPRIPWADTTIYESTKATWCSPAMWKNS